MSNVPDPLLICDVDVNGSGATLNYYTQYYVSSRDVWHFPSSAYMWRWHFISNDWIEPVFEVGALYNPNLLADYCGDLFQHKFAQLVQQDIKDTNDDLVPPWFMHEKLHPWTVVVVDAILACWHILPTRGSSKGRNVRARSLKLRLLHTNKHRFTSPSPPHTNPPRITDQMSQLRNSDSLPYPANSNRKLWHSTFQAFWSPSKKARHL